MNILVIGLGSMGKRRLRLLQQYCIVEKKKDWHLFGVDSSKERCGEVERLFKVKTFMTIDEALEEQKFDGVVISTPPLSHSKIIEQCLQNNLHVFSEINLVNDKYNENIKLANKNNKILFLSSTFMYRKEIEFLKKYIKKEKKGSYSYHIGQYLPEWHPWENYKNYFVNEHRTNACREIFAIDLPWLIDIFGSPKEIYSLHKKISNLELNYDDTYIVTIEHSSGIIGNLIIDIVTPKTERSFKFWNENKYIEWLRTPDSLKIFNNEKKELDQICLYDKTNHQSGYNSFIIENAYYDEIVNFIDTINNNAIAKYSFERDKEVLEWIDRIEK